MWDNVGVRITRAGNTAYASATGTLVPLPGVGSIGFGRGGSTVTVGRGGIVVLLGVTLALAGLHVWTRGYQG